MARRLVRRALGNYVRALESGAWKWNGKDMRPKADKSYNNVATLFAEWIEKTSKQAAKAAKPAPKAKSTSKAKSTKAKTPTPEKAKAKTKR